MCIIQRLNRPLGFIEIMIWNTRPQQSILGTPTCINWEPILDMPTLLGVDTKVYRLSTSMSIETSIISLDIDHLYLITDHIWTCLGGSFWFASSLWNIGGRNLKIPVCFLGFLIQNSLNILFNWRSMDLM